jgi:hypothetical protein
MNLYTKEEKAKVEKYLQDLLDRKDIRIPKEENYLLFEIRRQINLLVEYKLIEVKPKQKITRKKELVNLDEIPQAQFLNVCHPELGYMDQRKRRIYLT